MSEELSRLLEKSSKLLESREGFEESIYDDSTGKATIGIGHLVSTSSKDKVSDKEMEVFKKAYKEATGKDLAASSFSDVKLSKEDALTLKRHDAKIAYDRIRNISGTAWEDFSDAQKVGLLSMEFQLGISNEKKYPNTISKIKKGQLKELSTELPSWSWAKQTPVRAKDAVQLLSDFEADTDELDYGKSSDLKSLFNSGESTQIGQKEMMNELSKPNYVATKDVISNVEEQEDGIDSTKMILPESQEEEKSIDYDIGEEIIETKNTPLDIEGTKVKPEVETISPLEDSIFVEGKEPSRSPAVEKPDIEVETKEPIKTSESETELETNEANTWGGTPQQLSSVVGELKKFTLDGMGDDLVNKFIDRNAVGFLMQAGIANLETSGKLDPSFNVYEDEQFFNEMTKGLDNRQIKEITEKSNNRADFITYTSLAQAQSQRKKEMDAYTSNHPVLSGVNSVSTMLAEAAAFMPVASVIGAATSATKIRKISELARSSIVARSAIGEFAEQGLQELIWSKYDRDYEFDPIMFAAALGVGVGLKQAFGNPEADRIIRDLLKNEGGFINIATDEGKRLVDEVSKNIQSNQATALAERIVKKKVKAANVIRKNLDARRASLLTQLNKTTEALKVAPPEKIKILKGQKQKLARQLEKFDKGLPDQLVQLAKGTHPKLTAQVNPEFSIKTIAKELGIDPKEVNTVEKTRKFLGLDQPNVDPNFKFEGEKSYQKIARDQLTEISNNRRLNMNETLKYMAGTNVVRKLDELPVVGRLQIGDKLLSLADTDGPVNRMLFNKGNLVSSDNELVSSFYNWLAPDGMGRQGMSKMRAIESQQKYASIYGGDLMTIFHSHGDSLYDAVKGKQVGNRLKGFISPDDYERTVEPLLKERLLDTTGQAFRKKYGNEIADIADGFYNDFNKLNADIVKRAKELGVEGVNFEATDGWFHRSWDFRKARAVDAKDLEDTVLRAMTSHAKKLDIEIDPELMAKNAKKFAYGIRNADMSVIEGLQSDHIKLLDKLANKSSGTETKVIRTEIARLKALKAKADAGDLANRVQMDVTQQLSDGRQLADLFEDNVIHTQKRYTSRMAARIAAAEHGIKNIDDMQDWINDAIDLEVKRLAAKGVKNPKEAVKHVKEAMTQDLQSFKHGGMVGIHDLPDDTASDFLRLVKKYNYARLMQYTGISSIAELGGTFVEAGVGNTLTEMRKTLVQHFNDLYVDSPRQYTNKLYDELRTITGVGMEDFAFSSKGLSASTRVTEQGVANTLEKGIDSIGRVTQGTFGGIETVGRRITANSLAIKWANHFTGSEKGGLLSAFFGANGISNRVLENSGFGSFNDVGEFVFNDTYKNIQSSIKKFASFDDAGRLTKLNLEKWDSNVAHSFGDAIQMQVNHIMVNPDPTTMALWQSTTVGQILNQFRTFTVNATTKVFGQTVGNAAISSSRGDSSELIKAGQKIFWGTSLGMLSVALRQGIQKAGGDKEVDLFDEGLTKAMAIGLSRSSVIGNIPTISDSISGAFGIDPIFDKTSSVGRSKNFFNLATTPTGQAVGGVVKSVEKVLQGEGKEGAFELLKTSPVYRQIGAQQIFNFIESDK